MSQPKSSQRSSQSSTNGSGKVVIKRIKGNNVKKTKWIDASVDADFESTAVVAKNTVNKRKIDEIDLTNDDEPKADFDDNRQLAWCDRFQPTTKNDVAVHKKKTDEVETWILTNCRRGLKTSKMLLLTGPSGSGKSTTLRTLCHQHHVEILEWQNPLSTVIHEDNPSDPSRQESQIEQFTAFVLRGNRYNSLCPEEVSTGKLLLVEELPNIFFMEPEQFRHLLSQYKKSGHCPLVLIMSDAAGSESNWQQLVNRAFQMEMKMDNIVFNPVAPTIMKKLLTMIAGTMRKKGYLVPSAANLNAVCEAAAGDLRQAINTLQFLSVRRATRVQSTETQDVGQRDQPLVLFRALGKVLHNKREETGACDDALPDHLRIHRRKPLAFVPETVLEQCALSGNFLSLYLHQNYPDFYHSIDDLVRASEYFSDADALVSRWENRDVLSTYSTIVAVRGLLHSNSSSAKSSGWRPLHKPQWFDTWRQMYRKAETARCLFQQYRWCGRDLVLSMIPYLAKINVALRNPGQISFVQEVGHFQTSRSALECLSEKDLPFPQAEVPDSPPAGTRPPAGSQEASQAIVAESADTDVEIEDFSD